MTRTVPNVTPRHSTGPEMTRPVAVLAALVASAIAAAPAAQVAPGQGRGGAAGGRGGGPPVPAGPPATHADLEYAPVDPATSNGHELDRCEQLYMALNTLDRQLKTQALANRAPVRQ